MFKNIILKLKLLFIPCQENEYRPRFLTGRFLTNYLILILILKIIAVPFIICFPKTIFFAEITKTALFQFANKERTFSNLSLLKENPKLDEAAYLKATDILEKDYFSHQSPEGISPWYWFQKVGYNYKFAGENLAIGFLDSEEVHQAWMDSFSHKANLLNPNYQEMGIAVLKGDFQGSEVVVAVQLFGTSQTAETVKKTEVIEKKEEEKLPAATEELQKPALQAGEVTPPAEEKNKNTLSFNFFQFTSLKYHNLLEKIIYASLIFVILSLLVTLFFDVFIYRQFEIQYKDILFNALGFAILFLIFLLIDKIKIIEIIPHNFSIY